MMIFDNLLALIIIIIIIHTIASARHVCHPHMVLSSLTKTHHLAI